MTTSPSLAPRRRRIVGGLLTLVVAIAVMTSLATPAAQATPSNSDELAFHTKLNELRSFFGQQGLHWDDNLAVSARSWTSGMIASGGLRHDANLAGALNAAVPGWTRGGENVGRGFNLQTIHDAFVNSGPHLANMVGDFNRVGIGVVRSGGEIWVTYRFAKAPSTGPGSTPTGSVDDAAQTGEGTLRVNGWALDPDTTSAIDVHVYVNGSWGGAFRANGGRADVGAAFPLYGSSHGYSGSMSGIGVGTHSVCTYAINAPGTPGGNPLLGCRSVRVEHLGSPFGSVDSAISTGPGTLRVSGWAIDPDTSAAIDIDVQVDGVVKASGVANTSRPDVGAAYPGKGNNHGYSLNLTGVLGGTHTVCVRGYNEAGIGTTKTIGCQTISLASSPFGSVDSVSSPAAGRVRVSGWGIDPDSASAIGIHVYIDGQWGGLTTANLTRSDVGAAYPAWGSQRGYTLTFNASKGTHSVCAYGINTSGTPGGNPLFACRTVTVG